MGHYDLKGIGTADVEKNKLSCKISMSSDAFFAKFANLEGYLIGDLKDLIAKAIDSKKEQKFKKGESELNDFFANVQKELAKSEARSAATSVDSGKVATEEKAKSEEKSQSEPKSESKEGEVEGNKVPIKVVEKIVAKYPYNYGVAEEKEGKKPEPLKDGYGVITRDGILEVENKSNQRIWDITGKITNNGAIEDIKADLSIKELAADGKETIAYKLKAEKEPALKVEEFISTSGDANTLSYSLNKDQDNKVLIKITIKNTEANPIKNIILKKALLEGNGGIEGITSSNGKAENQEGKIVWTIEEMAANATETMEFITTLKVEGKDQKVRSGTIEVSYDAESSLSDLKIENFEAFGNNKSYHTDEQLDDKPDIYKGCLVFENLSDYVAKLKNVSVKVEGGEELIKKPEGDLFLKPQEKYTSNEWEVDTKGEIPAYTKEVSFILLSNLLSTTNSVLNIEDIELSVAIFEAGITYDLKAIQSYREVPFHATHKLSNPGVSTFDYISIKHVVPKHFKPPKKDELVLKIDGKEVKIPPEAVTIKPDDEDPQAEHEIFVELKDMRNNEDLKGLKTGQSMELFYPLTAVNLTPEDKLITNAEWTANTYPLGKPIVITQQESAAEAAPIPVTHERVKLLRGKEIQATADPAVYEVQLTITNNSNKDLVDYKIKDRVPDAFDAIDSQPDASEHTTMGDLEVLVWKFDKIAQGESKVVKYKIKANNPDKARASGAQVSL